MARPTRAAQAELEGLESLAALLTAMADEQVLLKKRLKAARTYIAQAERRAQGQPYLPPILDRLREVVEPAQTDIGKLESAISDAQRILAGILESKQAQRVEQNNGG